MHLRAIKLRGFKSFPDPVELRFEPGVAVVVGPNGSGKSNVADAIVWAAGSQAPSELRAEKHDDVLFAGSAGRVPADFCDVELVFDNSEGRFAGLDFSEVSIARRLHRGGEGQYLVNRAAVRRIDLVELLADVGLGGGMHSIIGQGKVEAILSSKPSELRSLVEEAAGLGRFKRRRHRAELKLARVAIQVERARDLEGEVRSRLRPLALQATAAERAEKLAAEIAGLRARVAQLDLTVLEERAAAANERKAGAGLARRRADEKLEELLRERAKAEEELADAAGRREAATAALYRIRSVAERLELRQETAHTALDRLRGELVEVEAARDGVHSDALRQLERVALDASSAAQAAAGERERRALDARSGYARLAARERAAAAEVEERLAALRTERAGVEEELADAAGSREAALQKVFALRSAGERVALRRDPVGAAIARLRDELAQAREAAAWEGPSPEELERAAEEAAAAARAATHERDALTERARLARERLAALERSLAEREGIPPAARALAEAGEQLALALLKVEPGAERAVAAALAWRASALVASDPVAGLSLLERARSGGLGSLAVVLERTAGRRAVTTPAGATPLSELVSGPPAAVELLAGVVVVDPARLLATESGIAVTREGHGYDAERGELWFAGETAEAVLLELEARRDELAREADELEGAAKRAANAVDETAAAAERARAKAAQAAPRKGLVRADPERFARLVDAAERLDEALLGAASQAARLEEPLRERADRGGDRSSGLAGELRRLGEAEGELRREAAAFAERIAGFERRIARLGGDAAAPVPADDGSPIEIDVLEALLEQAAAAASEASGKAQRAAAAFAEASPRAGLLRVDPVSLRRLADVTERLRAALHEAVGDAVRLEAPLRARVDAGSLRTGELADELRRLGAAEVEVRREAQEAAERAAAIDVELARIGAEADDARRRLGEAGAEPAEPAEDDDRATLAEKVERLERRREALGRVNPLAKEEYEREKERLEELSTQRADLEASLDELEKLRAELTETVESRFEDTFSRVRENFEDVAATLFPGGEGRLRLVEPEEGDEEGEPGVAIELRPAGKKVTHLSLLSGGEKSLGAISFLFALFLAHPCPFYLLDEVEAALDDQNIGRFVELLRRYADRAQFIVITHQKRTMEAADILYGVTMGGDGVSQVVSRRLPRETPALASA